jgi:AMMECR1 domain-containing protein
MLPKLTVEVSLLSDDGELGARSQSFVDRVITLEHGVGFERKGGWHYLLPDATHRAGRTPSTAYRQLFSDNGVPADSLADGDLRLYRVAVQQIGSSEPPPIKDDGLSDVQAPSEVLNK